MNFAVFVTIWSMGASSAEVEGNLLGAPLALLKATPQVQAVEIYVPATGDLPKMHDRPEPTAIVQIDLDTLEAAKALTAEKEFKRLFTDESAYPGTVEKISVEILEPIHYDLPGMDSPPPRTAPLSFVVRYYGPVEDAAEFTKFYTTNHPPLLAKFPDIRNVLCYLPPNWQSKEKISDSSLFLGNEVVFDDLAALNRALTSDALPAVIEDGDKFASFGHSTHHAMQRQRVYERGDH